MFWKKKKDDEVVFHFYTHSAPTYAAFRPDKSNRFMPSFIKTLMKSNTLMNDDLRPITTMTKCSGFLDLYKRGFAIPSWSDIRIGVSEIGSTETKHAIAAPYGGAEVHPTAQRGEFAPDDKYQHYKLVAPWLIKSSESVPCLWVPPTYNNNHPTKFITLTGVMDYGVTQGANVNILIPKSDHGKMIQIDAGEPLVFIYPMTQKKIRFEYHLVSEDQFIQMSEMHMNQAKFSNPKVAREIAEKAECPFHAKK